MPVVRHRLGAFALAGLLLAAALPGVAASPTPPPPVPATAGPAIPTLTAGLLDGLVSRASAASDRLRSVLAELAPASTGHSAAAGSTISYGQDGRLTILVLGSDYRPGYRYQEHTDLIMVVSLDPASGKVAMASIPRSSARFPIHPDNRTPGGAKHSADLRVNFLYGSYKAQAEGVIERAALDRFRMDVAHALRLEIDYYAYIRFTGFDVMVDTIGGVRVDIPARIVDPYYRDSATSPAGIRFPAASDWILRGGNAKRCSGTTKDCKRGIVYVRSRKGTVGTAGNSDSRRARRQQEFLIAATMKVATGGADLELMRSGSISHITTDMPRTSSDAVWLRDRLKNARFPGKARVVFDSPAWATDVAVPKDSAKLKLKAVRGWILQKMGPA